MVIQVRMNTFHAFKVDAGGSIFVTRKVAKVNESVYGKAERYAKKYSETNKLNGYIVRTLPEATG